MKKKVFLHKFLYLVMISTAVISCTPDDPGNNNTPDPETVRFVVANEGNYGKATASLTAVLLNDSVKKDVFKNANGGRPLGDVAQSYTVVNGKGYACLSNSGKIEVVNPNTFASIKTIYYTDGPFKGINPNYVYQLNDTLAALTTQGDRGFYLLSTKSDELFKFIETPNNTKMMAVSGDKLYGMMGAKMIEFDIPTQTLTETYTTPESTVNYGKVMKGADAQLWVFSSKGLFAFNPQSKTASEVYTFPADYKIEWWSRGDISFDGKTIYIGASLNDEFCIVKFDVASTTYSFGYKVPEVTTFYNIAVSPQNTVLIPDALDYVQSGIVHEYGNTGELIKEFVCGIIPQDIYFVR